MVGATARVALEIAAALDTITVLGMVVALALWNILQKVSVGKSKPSVVDSYL